LICSGFQLLARVHQTLISCGNGRVLESFLYPHFRVLLLRKLAVCVSLVYEFFATRSFGLFDVRQLVRDNVSSLQL
jgi:hypothetical protein